MAKEQALQILKHPQPIKEFDKKLLEQAIKVLSAIKIPEQQ